MRLEDVRAIVTGAASGLGRHFTLELARAGASVAAGDLNAAGLDRLREECSGLPGRVSPGRVDVSQEPSVAAFVEEAARQLGGANVLVNNAGIVRDSLLVKDEGGWVRKMPAALWKQVMDVNLTGHFLMTREVVADMLTRGVGQGLVVNISSVVTRCSNPGQSNYAASKAGLEASTRAWSLELAPAGVRVCAVAPGLVETPILEEISPAAAEALLAGIPLGRPARPEEVWLALKFAIECDYFTGGVLEVDGGAHY